MFEEIRTAVAALEAVASDLDPGRFDGRDAADLFELLGRGERVCAAAKILLARRVDETGMWREGGHRSAAHWVAEATGETVGAAARNLDTARALDELPRPTPRSAPGGCPRRRPPISRALRVRTRAWKPS